MPVKDLFFVCLSLVSLMDANLIGFQSWVFWEPQNTLVDILKARILVVWFKPFTPQGEDWDFEFLPDCGSLHEGVEFTLK